MPPGRPSDYRIDPFTGADNSVYWQMEPFTIPSVAPFEVPLKELPRQDSPSTMIIRLAHTTQTQGSPSQDSYISQAAPTTNYGTQTYLLAGMSGASQAYRSLIQFDVSSLPGAVINATLVLTLEALGGTPQTFNCHEVTATWSSGTVTWNTAPSYNLVAESSSIVYTGNGPYEFDVTALYNHWKDGSHTNFGLLIKHADETQLNTYRQFSSVHGSTGNQAHLRLTVAGAQFTEDSVSITPQSMEVAVSYSRGYMRFNTAQAGQAGEAWYWGTGSPVDQIHVGQLDRLIGNGEDGDLTVLPTFSLTGTTTNTSTTISGLPSTNGILPGMAVSGTGIPAGNYVVTVVNSTTITINVAATASGTPSLTFGDVTTLVGGWGTLAQQSCTTTNSSPLVVVADSTQLQVGLAVAGSGIPVGSRILRIVDATHVYLTQLATASGTATLTFRAGYRCANVYIAPTANVVWTGPFPLILSYTSSFRHFGIFNGDGCGNLGGSAGTNGQGFGGVGGPGAGTSTAGLYLLAILSFWEMYQRTNSLANNETGNYSFLAPTAPTAVYPEGFNGSVSTGYVFSGHLADFLLMSSSAKTAFETYVVNGSGPVGGYWRWQDIAVYLAGNGVAASGGGNYNRGGGAPGGEPCFFGGRLQSEFAIPHVGGGGGAGPSGTGGASGGGLMVQGLAELYVDAAAQITCRGLAGVTDGGGGAGGYVWLRGQRLNVNATPVVSGGAGAGSAGAGSVGWTRTDVI